MAQTVHKSARQVLDRRRRRGQPDVLRHRKGHSAQRRQCRRRRHRLALLHRRHGLPLGRNRRRPLHDHLQRDDQEMPRDRCEGDGASCGLGGHVPEPVEPLTDGYLRIRPKNLERRNIW
uniref:Uncharacterized protein n=1 Tax=Steinernema glaseri TaxID=37863 RepID=A0A1I8AFI6_9BILA